MRSFQDSKGRSWHIVLNGWTLRQVKENSGVLLTLLLDENADLFAKLYTDPILLADVVWGFIREQAENENISLRDFAESFEGDTVGEAREAVVEATVDFFDNPEKRQRLRKLKHKILEIAEAMETKGMEALEKIDPDSLVAKFIGDSTNSLASAE